MISRFGVPLPLHSDQGRNLEGSVMRELCSLLGMIKARTKPYHPQCDGLVERLNRTLLYLLSKHVDENQKNWNKWIATVLMVYRLEKQSPAQETPFKLMFGRNGRQQLDVIMEGKEQVPQLTSEYVSALSKAQMKSMERVRECLAEIQQNQAKAYNKKLK